MRITLIYTNMFSISFLCLLWDEQGQTGSKMVINIDLIHKLKEWECTQT